jgi:small subunit ribosomal protein S6
MDSVTEKYKKLVTDLEGIIIKVDNWGKRRLAYPIRKKREGFYILIDFGGEHTIIQELERNFKIDDRILRYQSVKLSDKIDAEVLEREIAEAKKDKTSAEIPPPEEKSDEPAHEETAGEPEEESSQEEKTGGEE